MNEAFGAILFGVLFLVGGALGIAAFVFWIVKVLEVARIPEHQYAAAGTEKLTWVLVVALAGAIGALIWHFAKRREVLDAAGRMPGAPPGWYPSSGAQGLRWWDGTRWTEHSSP